MDALIKERFRPADPFPWDAGAARMDACSGPGPGAVGVSPSPSSCSSPPPPPPPPPQGLFMAILSRLEPGEPAVAGKDLVVSVLAAASTAAAAGGAAEALPRAADVPAECRGDQLVLAALVFLSSPLGSAAGGAARAPGAGAAAASSAVGHFPPLPLLEAVGEGAASSPPPSQRRYRRLPGWSPSGAGEEAQLLALEAAFLSWTAPFERAGGLPSRMSYQPRKRYCPDLGGAEAREALLQEGRAAPAAEEETVAGGGRGRKEAGGDRDRGRAEGAGANGGGEGPAAGTGAGEGGTVASGAGEGEGDKEGEAGPAATGEAATAAP